MSELNTSRPLGALLCLASAAVAICHIYFGYLTSGGLVPPQGLAFALPVTVGVLVATGLGFWLGWIMLTTGESKPETGSKAGKDESN
ncbi:MAG: hypothetical protein ACLFUR_02215 [Candidatus Hadarchaeia archaeon]